MKVERTTLYTEYQNFKEEVAHFTNKQWEQKEQEKRRKKEHEHE